MMHKERSDWIIFNRHNNWVPFPHMYRSETSWPGENFLQQVLLRMSTLFFFELPAAEVCATLQVRIPAGYPTSATPKVFVERSRGIGDVPRHVSVYDVARSRNAGPGVPQY